MNKSNKYPIQFKNGDFGCPYCKIVLVSGKVPIYDKHELEGCFDGIKCKICNYGLLTEEGFSASFGTKCSSINGMVLLSKFGETEFKSSGTNDIEYVFPLKIELYEY